MAPKPILSADTLKFLVDNGEYAKTTLQMSGFLRKYPSVELEVLHEGLKYAWQKLPALEQEVALLYNRLKELEPIVGRDAKSELAIYHPREPLQPSTLLATTALTEAQRETLQTELEDVAARVAERGLARRVARELMKSWLEEIWKKDLFEIVGYTRS